MIREFHLGDKFTRDRDGKEFELTSLGVWHGRKQVREVEFKARDGEAIKLNSGKGGRAWTSVASAIFRNPAPPTKNNDHLLPEYFI
jgi:hypothetical protein